MAVDLNRLKFLLERYSNNTISRAEFDELCELAGAADGEALLIEELKSAPIGLVDKEKMDRVLARVIGARGPLQETPGGHTTQVVPMYRRSAFKWIAAAAVIVMIVGGWWLIERRSEVGGQKPEVATTHDVAAPKSTKAMITLADGTKVYLDSVGSGTIAQQSGVDVVRNEDGSINYQLNRTSTSLSTGSGAKTQGTLEYNMAYNPRGSKVLPLTLNDGTKVWLNAESSLKYPAAFTGSTREVEITGEAYFEVAHNGKQPFKVHLPNGSIVEDIGTAFNVNAYTDEADVKTTLIEGAVKITANKNSKIIKPGQQAVVALRQAQDDKERNLELGIRKDIDLDEVMAWKNGRFVFDKTDIQTTMRQIARWYDVDIEYRGNVHGGFIGSMPRKENASQVLKMLEMTGAVHFQIEGRKIIVMP